MELQQAYLTNNPCYQANVTPADDRYAAFQHRGPLGLMLHSVGCAQPKAQVFVNGWNQESYDRACVHAFIDANTGVVWQTLPWNYRAWHCGGSGNNTHLGVELCESGFIRYTGANHFEILDREAAQADAKRTYDAGVELFAALCVQYGLDPATAILSHREGYWAGIASNHGDPEHYWTGLGLPYTMDTFRAAVAAAMKPGADSGLNPPEPPPAAQDSPGEGADMEETESTDNLLPFPDTPSDAWYADALRWAVETRLVQPSTGAFHPDNPLTKAAAVVWLRRLYRLLKEE